MKSKSKRNGMKQRDKEQTQLNLIETFTGNGIFQSMEKGGVCR